MNNFITKSSLLLLVASIAIRLSSCESDYVNLKRKQFEKELIGLNRKNLVSFMIGDIEYIVAKNPNKTIANKTHLWAYNTKTKIWSQMADSPEASQIDTNLSIPDVKHNGANGKGGSADWKYDPTSNSWKKM
ncbi:hypothetical protein MUK70_14510 [Dyadobacter chenwenxiniae]|uniref:Uncharacterized protein n=1 Tax=Dyadobacter chenwenxiniae TaxID=2906456 RepID=A0A9X1PI28_9BACT|nr:hypothetical protein [Dyadobacter chenwenxiniae]MCF0060454.1 hypothetical protein [Dyadobacter chenwenxiniae]UON86185.1 hypothetical protein MUK70_14510 [Dyadobacter chenwenxiniae]